MCHLGRELREKYEGRGEKRGGSVRVDETRKWNEGPSGEIETNGDPHHRNFD